MGEEEKKQRILRMERITRSSSTVYIVLVYAFFH